MGQGALPKAVESIVVERHAGSRFRVGLAEMNGWRPAMEDSHVAVMRDSWGFFGVFDGHGGSQCSAFVANRLTEELTSGPLPADDAAVKALMLKLDQEFLDSQQPSGSTGTFVLVQPSDSEEGRFKLRVGNIGDSRVLLGRADGSIVEGPGTDGGLTTDHKPDVASERERIERTGGSVQFIQGVARVNGDLAVSRAFGDAQHKTGGPKQEDHPVSAEPEFTTTVCDASDFVVLVCDGISEGNFPNKEVIQLAAEKLKEGSAGGSAPDLAMVSAAVCRRALERGSTDNLSCMIVQLCGGEAFGPAKELLPGPLVAPKHAGFRKAYSAMAERAGLDLAKAAELRYDAARRERVEAMTRQSENGSAVDAQATLEELRSEIAFFGEGPPKDLEPGSRERHEWFSKWLDSNEAEGQGQGQLLNMLMQDPNMLAMAKQQGLVRPDDLREVQVASIAELRPAVEQHPALKWDDRLAGICGQRGRVLQDDPADGTSQVRFPPPTSATAWLPTSALHSVDGEENGPVVLVAPEEQLRPAVEAHDALNWYAEMSDLCGKRGVAMQQDEADGTTHVRFPPPLGINAWLPTSCLLVVEDDENAAKRSVRAPALDILRPAVEEHPALKWHDQLSNVCGQVGRVLQDDESDGTCQVSFAQPRVVVWLPTDVLLPREEGDAARPAAQEEAAGQGPERSAADQGGKQPAAGDGEGSSEASAAGAKREAGAGEEEASEAKRQKAE